MSSSFCRMKFKSEMSNNGYIFELDANTFILVKDFIKMIKKRFKFKKTMLVVYDGKNKLSLTSNIIHGKTYLVVRLPM